MVLVAKTTSINLRITPQFRNELQALADYRGLSLSSLAHSLLVKAVRMEKQIEPDAFTESERQVNGMAVHLNKPDTRIQMDLNANIPARRIEDVPKKKNKRVS